MCIYRFFQFAIVAYLLSLLMVECRPNFLPHTLLYDPSHAKVPELRRYNLYNRCSHQHLQIPGKNVRTGSGSFDELLVRDVGPNSTMRIQGFKSKAYLCFTKRGKLKARFQFVSDNCVFEEKIDDNMYTELWLHRKNKLWKVGFDRKGRPLTGDSYNKRIDPKCFQFMKRLPQEFAATKRKNELEKLVEFKGQQHSNKHSLTHPYRHRHRHRQRLRHQR